MFDSGISAAELISELKEEIDVALPIPNKYYVQWLNSLEHLIYTEFIKEQNEIILTDITQNPIEISSLSVGDNESDVRFEDIYTIYADNHQLIKSTLTSAQIFMNTWYKAGEDIGYHVFKPPEEFRIIYFVKPKLKTTDENDNISEQNVCVPIEFIDMVKAKLRGESYKLANEDAVAAKWINDYNILLENFKVWISTKSSQFGM